MTPKTPLRQPIIFPSSSSQQKSETAPGNATTHTAAEMEVGMKINHTVFGKGTVTAVDTSSPNHIIHVDFDTQGSKKLLLKFAKFEILQ